MLPLPPATPLFTLTTTPGSRAATNSEKVRTGARLTTSLASTVAMVLPNCFLDWATPAPVTTISSSAMTEVLNSKFNSCVAPGATVSVAVWLENPTTRA